MTLKPFGVLCLLWVFDINSQNFEGLYCVVDWAAAYLVVLIHRISLRLLDQTQTLGLWSILLKLIEGLLGK